MRRENIKNEFNVGSEVREIYSLTDITPTILELLTEQPHQNSFVFALQEKRKRNYEDCHILTQPYHGTQVVVVKGLDKYLYSLDERTVTYFDLEEDWYEQDPKVIKRDLSYKSFQEQYFCDRFKGGGVTITLRP